MSFILANYNFFINFTTNLFNITYSNVTLT